MQDAPKFIIFSIAVAAALTPEVQGMEGEKVGVILCGGNVDLDDNLWIK